jgi:hypothetical protein
MEGGKMPGFSDRLVEKAWERSGRSCECEHAAHGHQGKCGKSLLIGNRGDKYSFYGWEAHSKSGMYLDSLDDCEILCWDPCYIGVLSKKHEIHV